jgi:hypothetical protein
MPDAYQRLVKALSGHYRLEREPSLNHSPKGHTPGAPASSWTSSITCAPG